MQDKPEASGDDYCTTREAARLLDVSLRTAQIWVERGLLDAWKTQGGHRRITRASVMRLLSDRGIGGVPHLAEMKAAAAKLGKQGMVRILVVEDDVALLKLYRARMLQWRMPVELVTAKNGYEALVQLGRTLPDLLVSDLRLPGLDGFDLLRAICSIDELADLEIAVVTGLDQAAIDERGGLPSRVRLYSKPVPFDALEALVNEIAESRQLETPMA